MKYLVYVCGAIFMVQSLSFTTGLGVLVFADPASLIRYPSWSSVLGGLGSFLYFVAGFLLFVVQELLERSRLRRDRVAENTVGMTSHHQLQVAPPAYSVSTAEFETELKDFNHR